MNYSLIYSWNSFMCNAYKFHSTYLSKRNTTSIHFSVSNRIQLWDLPFHLLSFEAPSLSLILLEGQIILYVSATATAKSLQSCPTLCDPIDGSPPGSAAPGILQARTLEWVAISFSNALKWKVKVKSLSRVRLSATPWTAAHQAPPSMWFSRQEYWSGVPLSSLGHGQRTFRKFSSPWSCRELTLQTWWVTGGGWLPLGTECEPADDLW